MQPHLSVIVPVFKTEKYLDKCLLSIRAQTLENIEIICVDDCSPDQSAKIIEKHRALDSRIIYIKHDQNLGLGGARNTGIRAARSEWIGSVDSDDYIKPNMFERMLEAAEGGEHDIVCCAYERVDHNGNVLQTHRMKSGVLKNEENSLNIFSNVSPSFWNKIWKKSLYEKYDIFFPEHVFYQDFATTPRILSKAKSIRVIEDTLYLYLTREDSASYTYSAKHLTDYAKVFQVISDFLHDNNIENRYKGEFLDYVSRGVGYHARNVMDSGMTERSKVEYLKTLFYIKIGFNTTAGLLNSLAAEEVQRLVENASTASDLKTVDGFREIPLTVLVKTFLRPEDLKRFLISAGQYERRYQIRFSEIIVGDDSPEEFTAKNRKVINSVKELFPGIRIKHDVYDVNIGLSAGRNRLVEAAGTDLVLLCDDDFILDIDCDVEAVASDLLRKNFDIVGGWLKNKYNEKTGEYEFWGSRGKYSETSEELFIEVNEKSQMSDEIVDSDYILNFFVARKNVLLSIPWDEDLKLEEHQEFFYRHWKRETKIGFSNKLFVKHIADRTQNSEKYNYFRYSHEHWKQFLFLAILKMGKKKRTFHRWRDGYYVNWHVDALLETTKERRIELREETLGLCVPCDRITPEYQNYFFGYFDISSVDEKNTFALALRCPIIDRLPVATDKLDIVLIDLLDKSVNKIGSTNAWCHQQGASLQFIPGRNQVIFNSYDEMTEKFFSKTISLETREERDLDLPVSCISQDGTKALSLNFSRLYDYRPGYGYVNREDPWTSDNAPPDDGLFFVDLNTGNSSLILSYADLSRELSKGPYGEFQCQKWVINHATLSPDSKNIFMLVRTFSDDPPFPTFAVLCDAKGRNIRQIFGFVSHYHWKDDEVILVSGAPGFTRKEAKRIGVYEINTKDGSFTRIGADELIGDGHCTYSPDRSKILYDNYPTTEFPYRKIQIYDLEKETSVILGQFYAPMEIYKENPDLRCDLHPRWSPDGKNVTFDSIHEGYRAQYLLDLRNLEDAELTGEGNLSEEDYKIWYRAKYLSKGRALGSATSEEKLKIANKLFDEGKLAYHKGDLEEAAEFFSQSLIVNSQNAALIRCLAEVLVQQNERRKAIHQLKIARKLLPRNKNLKKRILVLRFPILRKVFGECSYPIPENNV